MKKINLDKVKNFLFDHGEKVALGTCLFLAMLLGTLGILRASGAARDEKSGKTWSDAFRSEYTRIQGLISGAKPDAPDAKLEERLVQKFYIWDDKDHKFQQAPYTQIPEGGGSRRDNPKVMRVNKDAIHWEYFRGLVLKHEHGQTQIKNKTLNAVKVLGDVDPNMKGPNMGLPQMPVGGMHFAQLGQPQRMVIVTMVFPMKEQVAEYVRALKMKNQTELFNSKEDLPKPTGFNLRRFEMVNGQPVGEGEVMLQADKDGKLITVSKSLKNFYRDVIFDEKLPELLEPYIFGTGTVMPTPKLAYGKLEKFNLPGITVDWTEEADPAKKGNMQVQPKREKGEPAFKFGKKPPVPIGPKDPKDPMEALEYTVKDLPEFELKKVNPSLASRLFDSKINLFHPLGEIEPLANAAANPNKQFPGMQPQMGQPSERYFTPWDIKVVIPGEDPMPVVPMPMVNPPKGGEQPGVQGPERPDWDRDAIVRFIDPEVEPGKTYSYYIQVRFANPNFGKNALVSFDGLAAKKELDLTVDHWVATPSIPIPNEYAVYAVDQPMLDEWATNPGSKPGPADAKFFREWTSFQVHQWVRKVDNGRDEFIVGDWAIAERLLVRKGEFIGMNALVQVPVWHKERDSFIIPKMTAKDFKGKAIQVEGLRTDLMPPAPTGKKAAVQLPMPVLVDFTGGKKIKGTVIEEESAVDALIMTPQGRLVVLNSREDSDARLPAARERQDRVKKARDRVEDLKRPAEAPKQ